jgi:hypothetical protein
MTGIKKKNFRNKGIFFIPIEKPDLTYSKVLKRIIEKVLLVEKMNFGFAFFGEHLTDKYEKLSSSLMMISALSGITKKINLGTMTSNLTFANPAMMASLISTVDNLSLGRLLLGIGCGSNQCDVEFVGNLKKNNYQLMFDSIDMIEKLISSKNLISFKNENFEVTTTLTGDKKLKLGYFEGLYKKRNNLEILMPALGKDSKNVEVSAKNKWSILSSNFCDLKIMKNHIEKYIEHSGLEKKRAMQKIFISRFIFVCENEKDIERYLFSNNSPYMFMINVIYKKLKKAKKHSIFGENISSIKEIAKNIIIYGRPSTVEEKIAEIKKEVGNFRGLIYPSTSLAKNKIFDNSLELYGNEVSF